MQRKVHFIVGPTAVGKTFLSQLLAQKIELEIVSADSRQIYRYMDIGTAKPDAWFRQKVPHHFIDICDPDEYYSAGLFGKQARQTIEQIFGRNKVPLVVGGSGFYIKALVDGIFELDAKDQEIRNVLESRLNSEGLSALFRQLQEVDPIYAQKISPNDRQRILRSLEVFLITGKPFSSFHEQQPEPADFEAIFWGLTMERKMLYKRINQRVELMLKEGLIDEVKHLLEMGYSPRLNALNTVGYKEVIAYLQNQINYAEMVELIKRNTRRYAKRQLTWFRADKRITWVEVRNEVDFQKLAEQIIENLKSAPRF